MWTISYQFLPFTEVFDEITDSGSQFGIYKGVNASEKIWSGPELKLFSINHKKKKREQRSLADKFLNLRNSLRRRSTCHLVNEVNSPSYSMLPKRR
ncbi:Uncharacterized protein BM_BM1880 [Brugia malayi]|uniref:BMA-MPZ-2 n=2 Tax=Brugia TaxID=6278 RepID=A0A1U7F3U9_BRUMA|nr:Uncharacterized protein BM_BM1880 [Brugia malayi]CRZ23821.1 BMA-MPZ-2 [Brugia malayi]VIO86919.1 Uncharacterized protein BM_BM1880 [Brugia malayi]